MRWVCSAPKWDLRSTEECDQTRSYLTKTAQMAQNGPERLAKLPTKLPLKLLAKIAHKIALNTIRKNGLKTWPPSASQYE